jgi:hypothetical protein
VQDVRNLFVAVGLTAFFVFSSFSTGMAASAFHPAGVSYSSQSPNASYPSNASHVSRADEQVPPNCIRQSCGKLWCWQMRGQAGSH